MPNIFTTEQKENILKEILESLNLLGRENWNLSKVLLYLIKKYEPKKAQSKDKISNFTDILNLNKNSKTPAEHKVTPIDSYCLNKFKCY